MSDNIFLAEQKTSLEDMFFLKEEKKLIENYKKMKEMKESKESLSSISGIKNDAVLEKLVNLNIHPETLAMISIIPLIEVAWADGSIDENEKNTILKSIASADFANNKIDYEIMECWLKHKPEPKMLDAWTHYINGLCKELTSNETKKLREEILSHVSLVANASGGFFGLGKVSKKEKEMIKKLEKAFILN